MLIRAVVFRVGAVSAGRQPPAAPPLLRRRLSAPESGRRLQERENTSTIVPHEKILFFFSIKNETRTIQDFAFVCAAFYFAQCRYTLHCTGLNVFVRFLVLLLMCPKNTSISNSLTLHDVLFFRVAFIALK